jgi:hypothetical protein
MGKKFGLFDEVQQRFVAFYDTEAHGERTKLVPPSGWVPPEAPLIVDPNWREPLPEELEVDEDGKPIPAKPPMISDPDFVAEPPYYEEVPNPECKIPVEAVLINDSMWLDELANPKKYRVANGKVENNPQWPLPDTRPAAERRLDEYNKRGATEAALTVALWEKLVEGRPAEAERLQAIREQVKAEFPK